MSTPSPRGEPPLRTVALPFVFVLFIVACARDAEGPARPVVVIEQGEARASVTVELATTPQQRAQGLMFRRALGENDGMLFIFPAESRGGFWMRNTYIPLDIAYIGADLTIVDIRRGTPLDETILTPSTPYRYVLEVNAGWFEANGLGVGARVILPEDLPGGS
ncbi:DUF192 domain-containing protein [Tepidiforma sp.]|uniref:DUF192 domain-containing protein n=1 Tax=Tepidiforma sp. TaxID=2682230 RepID=UPI002ADDD816|nr:DUF192 domain-containing protein [Tepidiforma sp.]